MVRAKVITLNGVNCTNDLDSEGQGIWVILICQRLDEEVTVPEKKKERVAVSEADDPTSI